jgi:hypothetical protein
MWIVLATVKVKVKVKVNIVLTARSETRPAPEAAAWRFFISVGLNLADIWRKRCKHS